MIKKLNEYFKHKKPIQLGVEGEFSKITEEYHELEDAVDQNKKYFACIEAADLTTVIGHFTWNKYKVPLIVIVLFAYIRKPYKWIRNPFLVRKYGKRTSF